MLINQQYPHVLSFAREGVEPALDLLRFGLGVDDEEVGGRVRRGRDVADAREEQAGYGVFVAYYGEELTVLVRELVSVGR